MARISKNHSETAPRRPTSAEVQAAYGRTVPDLIAPDLRMLFCGINPSLYSAAVGHHFARPGNRFWPTLQAAGYSRARLRPDQEQDLLAAGYGITNLVDRATARADELSPAELSRGAERLARKVARFRPACVAFLGAGAYRTAFARAQAAIGLQEQTIGGAHVWVLPNPSGLNAHYQLADLAALYRQARLVVERGFS